VDSFFATKNKLSSLNIIIHFDWRKSSFVNWLMLELESMQGFFNKLLKAL